MAGGWGRFVGEWLVSLIVSIASVLWFAVMTLIVLPFTLVKSFVVQTKPKEFSSILITGASSGIGAQLARAYAQKGVKLVLTARRAEKLAFIKKECEDKGAAVKILVVDATNKDDMNEKITAADDESPLDLVIANAGVHEATLMLQGHAALSLDTQFAVTSTNCVGVVNTVAPVMTRMKERGHGQLVVMASTASLAPISSEGWAAYSASKAWARAYGIGLRGILAPSGVGVTTVCPGFVESEMFDDIKSENRRNTAQSLFAFAITAETMVERTKEAIAYDVPEFFIPWNSFMVSAFLTAMNVFPPVLRLAMPVVI